MTKKEIEELNNEELLDLYKTITEYIKFLNKELEDDNDGK